MSNKQQAGMDHRFLKNVCNDKSNEQEKENPLWRNGVPTSKARHSWQIARDISIDILSRKTTRLSIKPDDVLTSAQPLEKKHVPYQPSAVSESFPSYRVPRMPTEKEASEVSISYEDFCSFCEGRGVGNYIHCRICPKIYHLKCLFQRGYISNQSFNFSRFAKQDWNCPECSDLTQLLNQDELDRIIDAFEQMDRDHDGYIVLEEFLSFRLNSNTSDGLELFIQYNSHSGRKLFSLMDSTQKGVIIWSEFALFYGCKLIAIKEKIELIKKLTRKELVMARKLFLKDPRRTFDNRYNIIITREYFTQIHDDLLQSLKNKYGIEFLDMILSDENDGDDPLKKLSTLNWSEFLRELSLLLLLNRRNDDAICSQSRRASIPPHLSKASRSIFPRIEIGTPRRLTLSRSVTPVVATANIFCDQSFRKHAKILEKLNQRSLEEELKRKKMGSEVGFTIVENLHGEENLHLPKLKINARDDRKAVVDPWTAVKEMEQLRNQLGFYDNNSSHLKMLQTDSRQ